MSFIRSPSGIVTVETVLLAVLMFGTFSVLVRVTDMETVGLWALVNSLLGFSRAADFWSRGLSSFVGEARGHNNRSDANTFVMTAVISGAVGYAVLAIIGAGLIWLFAPQLAGTSHADTVRTIAPLMATTFWLLAVTGTYSGAFLAFGHPLIKAVHTVGGAVLFLALVILFARNHGLWGILVAQATQALVVLTSSALIFQIYFVGDASCSWRRKQFIQLASFGSKAVTVGFLQLSVEPMIRLLANQFGGLSAVAAVEMASRLIAVVRSLITGLGQILVPEFARLLAKSADDFRSLYLHVNRIFLVASMAAFSIPLCAAPSIEELMLGRNDTNFVIAIWLLSLGWLINTATSGAYFMLQSQRRLRPLFWSHAIMAGGTILLGTTGGILMGVNGALAGVTLAIAASSIWLTVVAGEGMTLVQYRAWLMGEPAAFLPLICAVVAVVLYKITGLSDHELGIRLVGYVGMFMLTVIPFITFYNVRSLLHDFSQLR